jgi:hypothetical protein
VKLSRDLAGNLGLDRFEIFRIKLVPVRPAVFRRHRVGDLHVHPERRRAAALSASGNDVLDFWIAYPRRDVERPPLLCDPRERQPAAVAQEIGDEIVSKGFNQILLAVVTCQITQRSDSHCNIRQHTRPFWPRFIGDRRQVPDCGLGRKSGKDVRQSGRVTIRHLGRAAGSGALTGRARTRYLVGERLGFGVRSDSKFALQDFGAGAVLPQRFRPPPRMRIGADQGALTNLRKRVEGRQSTRRLDRRIMLARLVLQCRQALQDAANKVERAIPLGCEPFLEGLGVDHEVSQKFAAIQLRSREQLGTVRQTRKPLETLDVCVDILESAIGKLGRQVAPGAFAECSSQLQQAVAQTVARLIRTLIGPQQVGEPFAADRPAPLGGQIGQQSARLSRDLPEPAFTVLYYQGSEEADQQSHHYRPNVAPRRPSMWPGEHSILIKVRSIIKGIVG